MKKILIFCTLLFVLSIGYASEVFIDFNYYSGGGYNGSSMYTTAAGINGLIGWHCDQASWNNGSYSSKIGQRK